MQGHVYPSMLAAALALAGCATPRAETPQPCVEAAGGWREAATADDRRRLREWRTAWTRALAQAETAGHGPAIAREGVLLQPDAALPGAMPPPGYYRCRTIKIGARSQGLLDYVAYPAFQCRIGGEADISSFTKLTGSQRPIGHLYADSDRRAIFLGTLQLGDERRTLPYGSDPQRDVAGILERVGERRWRIVFPYPHFESLVDVLELVPAS